MVYHEHEKEGVLMSARRFAHAIAGWRLSLILSPPSPAQNRTDVTTVCTIRCQLSNMGTYGHRAELQ